MENTFLTHFYNIEVLSATGRNEIIGNHMYLSAQVVDLNLSFLAFRLATARGLIANELSLGVQNTKPRKHVVSPAWQIPVLSETTAIGYTFSNMRCL